MTVRAGALLSEVLTGPAAAEMAVASRTWVCERRVTIPVTSMSGPQGAIVVMDIEGRRITLHGESGPGSGRYSWPSGGSGYVWTEEAGVGRVLWRDGTNGTEAPILTGCRPAG